MSSTQASIGVDTVDTLGTVLTDMVDTVVNIGRTVFVGVACWTHTTVKRDMKHYAYKIYNLMFEVINEFTKDTVTYVDMCMFAAQTRAFKKQ